MNLLMIILIILGIWIAAAICYFAWRLTPEVESPPEAPTEADSHSNERDAGP